ncbi:uncharacterized protein LOC113347733 isoform X2 [Papaver somniferum]|uniref:uncharacterized protein LOC113347733 isoform X2 n=1 Tax=Papaver somniferum TaxID=3469 RepID=UPI000E6F8F2A|nr:uncharacterized protein LOC113347733 isoform X2 [Papaver somniferum]
MGSKQTSIINKEKEVIFAATVAAGFLTVSHASSSVSLDSSSLRSLKKRLKEKLSKKVSLRSSFSDTLNGEVSSKKGKRVMEREVNSKQNNCDNNEIQKMHEENCDGSDNAASQTSNSKKRSRQDDGDALEMAKGLPEKFKIISWNVNDLGHPDKHSKLKKACETVEACYSYDSKNEA